MNILIDICLGLFLAWAFNNLRSKTKYEKIVAAFIMIATILLVITTQKDVNIVLHFALMAGGIFIFFLLERLCGDVLTGIWNKLNKPLEIKDGQIDDEEDFMKTKQGKILSVICIILVIYMVISAVGIYKLNSKINSVYETVQSMKED